MSLDLQAYKKASNDVAGVSNNIFCQFMDAVLKSPKSRRALRSGNLVLTDVVSADSTF